jgi:uncharacterized membrane protein
MKTVSKIFFTGLATIVPVVVTVYCLVWLGKEAEFASRALLDKLELPGGAPDWPGLGIAVAVAFVLLVGLLMRAYVVRRLFGVAEAILERIPLVKTLYGSLRDLMGFFAATSGERQASQVVMVRLGATEVRLLGLLTREDFADLPAGLGGRDTVAVYLPMSYQLGGFTAMVPRSAVEPVAMSMEDAMRFAVTAGMTAGVSGGEAKGSA